jgi:large subunit ribosomal protein L14e
MSRHPTLPEIGRIVEVIRGRDKGLYAVVIGYEGDRFVYIADGDKRKVDRPKKKNALHVKRTGEIAQEIADTLAQGGKVTNARLRYVIRQYQNQLMQRTQQPDEAAEGGMEHGEG